MTMLIPRYFHVGHNLSKPTCFSHSLAEFSVSLTQTHLTFRLDGSRWWSWHQTEKEQKKCMFSSLLWCLNQELELLEVGSWNLTAPWPEKKRREGGTHTIKGNIFTTKHSTHTHTLNKKYFKHEWHMNSWWPSRLAVRWTQSDNIFHLLTMNCTILLLGSWSESIKCTTLSMT